MPGSAHGAMLDTLKLENSFDCQSQTEVRGIEGVARHNEPEVWLFIRRGFPSTWH